MNYKKVVSFFVMMFLAVGVSIIFTSGESYAISNVLPDTGNNNHYLLVSKIGPGNGLDAPVSYSRVYFNSPAGGNVQIWDANHCPAGPDANTPTPTTFLTYNADANEDWNLFFPDGQQANSVNQQLVNFFGNNICAGFSMAFTNLTESTIHPGMYTGVIVARHDGPDGGGGVNAFKLTAANANGSPALIGQYSQNDVTENPGDPGKSLSFFGTQDRLSADNTFSNFRYTFAPECDWGSRQAFLKWRDADFGQGNQGSNPQIGFFLIERNRVTGVQTNAWNVNVTGGQDVFEQYQFTARGDRTYEWVWYNVRKTNGLQIYMPFAEIETLNNCEEDPEYSFSGTATCSIEDGRAIFSVTNNGPDTAETEATIRYGINGLTTTDTQTIELDDEETWDKEYNLGPLSLGDEVFVHIKLDPENQDGGEFTAGSTTASCGKYVFRPTVQVAGADVWAGGSYSVDSGNWCTPTNPNASIDTNPGSNTNYAAYAVRGITNFGTSSANSNILSFANTPNLGNYNSQGKCATDYFAQLDKTNTVATPNYNQSGQYYVEPTSELVLPALSLPANRKITLIVDGDVRITENIVYNYSTVASRGQIPAFVLVASGKIDIAPGVTNLSGLYVAGTEGINSTINTCANGVNSLRFGDACSQQLTVNGAFMASRIEFRRTHGNLVTNVPAERFRVSPEYYLARPLLESLYFSDFETTSFQDLPPVY